MSAYTTPIAQEVRNQGWVEYKLGKDAPDRRYQAPNGYYLYLYDRAKGSTTNGSVIKKISDMIYGNGLSLLGKEDEGDEIKKFTDILSKKDLKRAIKDRKKLMACALQLTKNAGVYTKITYFPLKTLLPEIKKEGEIQAYYYCHDWSKHNADKKRIPAYGFGDNSDNEILIIGQYDGESEYFCEEEGYIGALAYAYLEEKFADYNINEIDNGFSATSIVNYNGRVPEPDKQKLIAKKTVDTLTGATGKKIVVAFNNNKEEANTIDSVPLDDAPERYRWNSEEAEAKILKGHRAISELLGFNQDSGGFSNNAEELKNKFIAFDAFEIEPYRNEFLDELKPIFETSGLDTTDLYIQKLMPFEFIDTEGMDQETVEEETGETQLSKDLLQEFIDMGEDVGEGWELIDEREVDYDTEEELDLQVQELNLEASIEKKTFRTFLQKIGLVSTGTARPNANSEQDEEINGNFYKVRYQYKGDTSPKSRAFCLRMTLANKLYRKEDIIRMSDVAVNPGWGPNGTNTYSIWLYKGGGNCHHRWVRKTFKFTSKTGDTKSPLAPTISTGKARKEGFNPVNEKEVSMRPKDMKNEGFLNPR